MIFVFIIGFENVLVCVLVNDPMYEDYKECEDPEIIKDKSQGTEVKLHDDVRVPQYLAETIEKCSSLFQSQEIDELLALLAQLKQFWDYNFSKKTLDFDYKSNIEQLIPLIQSDHPFICCSALKVLNLFYEFYPKNVENVLDNALILAPLTIFQRETLISYEITSTLIKSMIIGFDHIFHEEEIEKPEFFLEWLIHDFSDFEESDEDAEEEDVFPDDFDIENYLILCLKLLLQLTKHIWPMHVNNIEEIFHFIDFIFQYFQSFGLREGRGEECSELVINLCTSFLKTSPESITSEFIINTCCKIQDFFFFESEGMNQTFFSLLMFFNNCAQTVPKDICVEIFENISINELIDFVGDETNFLSAPATLLIGNYLRILPEKCAEHYPNEIRILAKKQLLLLNESKLLTKKIVSKFFLVLYENSHLFNDLCTALVVEKGFLQILHENIDAQDETISHNCLKILLEIAKQFNQSHEMILDEFADDIDNEDMEDIKLAINDVITE